MPWKFRDDICDGSGVIVLTDRRTQTDVAENNTTLVALHCAGGKGPLALAVQHRIWHISDCRSQWSHPSQFSHDKAGASITLTTKMISPPFPIPAFPLILLFPIRYYRYTPSLSIHPHPAAKRPLKPVIACPQKLGWVWGEPYPTPISVLTGESQETLSFKNR